MTPYFEIGATRIFHGDAREVLPALGDGAADCCVTSPPYWRLRDYGAAGQIGLEATFAEYLGTIVDVFEDVRRVLALDGTFWLNMGDSYANTSACGFGDPTIGIRNLGKQRPPSKRPVPAGLKRKDLVGQAWRVAFALQDQGWWLRCDIPWEKTNPMPESVKDRPTRCHEYVFLLSRSARYWYDHEATKEPVSPNTHARYARGRSPAHKWSAGAPGQPAHRGWAMDYTKRKPGVNPKAVAEHMCQEPAWKRPRGWQPGDGAHDTVAHNRGTKAGRNSREHVARDPGHANDGRKGPRPKQNESFSAAVGGLVEKRAMRSVWRIAARPSGSATHYAAFPPELARRCIVSGCRPGGVVLDPFAGTGTTGEVALALGRRAVLIEVNEADCEFMARRFAQGVFPVAGSCGGEGASCAASSRGKKTERATCESPERWRGRDETAAGADTG